MRTPSTSDIDTFQRVAASAHRSVVVADILLAGQPVVESLDVVSGSVSYDRQAGSLAQCTVTFAEPTRVPLDAADPLSPFGFEVRLRRGVIIGDTPSLVDLGVFPIQSTDVAGRWLTTSVRAVDRSQLVRDATFEDDYQIASGVNYATAIQTMINVAVPGLEYAFASTAFTTPQLTFTAGRNPDRWQAAVDMANAIGCELYFDGLGRLVLRPEPVLTAITPAWTVAEGDGGLLVTASTRLDRASTYNRVIAYSTNSSSPSVFRAVATDSDPASPTYYFGPFGRKPTFFGSPLLASTAQAQSAADTRLRSQLGIGRSVEVEAVTMPALEPGDVIVVRRDAIGLNEAMIVDALTIGLSVEDGMTIESRAKQEVL